MSSVAGSLRRRVAVLLALALLALASAASAAAPPPLVALILPQGNARLQVIYEAFRTRFAAVETPAGKPTLCQQAPAADFDALRASVRRAVAQNPELIVVFGSRAATAAQLEKLDRPWLFVDVFDPVAMGLVQSTGRGGEFTTGVCGHPPSQTLVRAVKDTLGPSRLALPVEKGYQAALIQVELLRGLGCHDHPPRIVDPLLSSFVSPCWLEVVPVELAASSDLDGSFRQLSKERVDAIYLGDLLPGDAYVSAIIDYAARQGVPVVSQLSGAAEQGALLTLEADPAEQGELLAELAARLLAGARPAEIPLQIPRRVSLVVNLKVARELGVEVPFSLLVQTTRLIR